ncbi:hypothetical protein OESDEN_01765 [Oesophagostomum dentatum]|uniref:Uncharacterized protein n=1 Tax=Oesophagostomum dentatum TaxID=61180 RepID=A0A0B1TL31_OESDE|nr:hypothetical protein OESDEN_01765 [Oesophagostomum dentatum]
MGNPGNCEYSFSLLDMFFHYFSLVRGDPRPKVLWLRDLVPIDIRAEGRYSVSTMGNPGKCENSFSVLDFCARIVLNTTRILTSFRKTLIKAEIPSCPTPYETFCNHHFISYECCFERCILEVEDIYTVPLTSSFRSSDDPAGARGGPGEVRVRGQEQLRRGALEGGSSLRERCSSAGKFALIKGRVAVA